MAEKTRRSLRAYKERAGLSLVSPILKDACSASHVSVCCCMTFFDGPSIYRPLYVHEGSTSACK